jgi:hypothetical protein
MIARIYLLVALVGSPVMAAAAACEDLEDVDERLGCLKGRYCADTRSDAERAKCYEDIVRGLLTGAAPPDEAPSDSTIVAPAAAPAPVLEEAVSEADVVVPKADQAVTVVEETTIPTEESAPEDAFGRRPEPVYQGDEPKRIGATITSVVEQRDGRLLIALDNGQVWEENEASTKVRRIRIGSGAEVSKILFGYIMRFEKGGSTRVRRLACGSAHAKRGELSKCKRAGYAGS